MMWVKPTLRRVLVSGTRSIATRRPIKRANIPMEVLDALGIVDDPIVSTSNDPSAIAHKPITSAHSIDVAKGQVSMLDSVAIGPGGKIIHGTYGDLGPVAMGIPLEYLALLGPAAEGAAALRTMLQSKKSPGSGTFLVFGAGYPSGFAAWQLANAAGHAVIPVVSSDHNGTTSLMESIKGMVLEPGTVVYEEYALSKRRFSDLVDSIVTGDECIAKPSPTEFVEEFKENLLNYAEMYPDTKPAAVSDEYLAFKYMPKDAETYDLNMRAYLSQFPPGSPELNKPLLDQNFSPNQLQIFRDSFWHQTTAAVSGIDRDFSPPHLAKDLYETPAQIDLRAYPLDGVKFPYSFTILDQCFPAQTQTKAGGPIIGAMIVATPDLIVASEKVHAAKTLREKAEALMFLTRSQKATFQAACSVAAQARKVGAPVIVVGGSLPGFERVEVTRNDIDDVLAAMDVDENGQSRMNFFIQIYRANNFPFYSDYAVHCATEAMPPPRQIIVVK